LGLSGIWLVVTDSHFSFFKNLAKENNAKIALVKMISYPAGIGLGESIIMDAVSRKYDMYKFDKILDCLDYQLDRLLIS